jgi:hypothetical protein
LLSLPFLVLHLS